MKTLCREKIGEVDITGAIPVEIQNKAHTPTHPHTQRRSNLWKFPLPLTSVAKVGVDLEGSCALDTKAVGINEGLVESIDEGGGTGGDGGDDAADGVGGDLQTVDGATGKLGLDGGGVDIGPARAGVDKGPLDPGVQQARVAVGDGGDARGLAGGAAVGAVVDDQVLGLADAEREGPVAVLVGHPAVDAAGLADLVPVVARVVLGDARELDVVVVLVGNGRRRGHGVVAAKVAVCARVARRGDLRQGGALGGGAAQIGEGAVRGDGGAGARSRSRGGGRRRGGGGRAGAGGGGRSSSSSSVDVDFDVGGGGRRGDGGGGGRRRGGGRGGGRVVVVAGHLPGDGLAVNDGGDPLAVGALLDLASLLVQVAVAAGVGAGTQCGAQDEEGGKTSHCVYFV